MVQRMGMGQRRWDAGDLVAPEWLNNGDNAWQLTAATLVGLQSVPGLMILYAGMGKALELHQDHS